MNRLRAFLSDTRAATAAEFALVLPLMLAFLFGIIDVGRYGWAINRAEKATQEGARFAVVTDPAASGLATFDYVGATVGGVTLTQGDAIPSDGFLVRCTSSSCTCVSSCPTGMTIAKASGSPSPFDRVVSRMQKVDPAIASSNVIIEYSASGVGFAGDPGMDIAPLTTVKLTGMQFAPITLLLFGANVSLPSFSYALTMEDGSGSQSY